MRGSSSGYSYRGGYFGLIRSFRFSFTSRVCYGCGNFGHFLRKCPSHGEVISLFQSVLPIRTTRSGVHGRLGGGYG